jgi:Tat protein secretion system quality control protein TatD with DNase activity
VLANLKGIAVEELARATTDNFFRLYGKAPRVAA